MKLRNGRRLSTRGGYGIDIALHHTRSTDQVFWSESGNSFVVAERNGRYVVYSINGHGEIRWEFFADAPSAWGRDEAAAVAYFFEA